MQLEGPGGVRGGRPTAERCRSGPIAAFAEIEPGHPGGPAAAAAGTYSRPLIGEAAESKTVSQDPSADARDDAGFSAVSTEPMGRFRRRPAALGRE